MPDTEKITINMGTVDLGRIDLLVEQGFYTTRTDFIRTAIRNQIDKHENDIQETINRSATVVGVLVYDASDLEKMRAKGEKLTINIAGMLVLNHNITPQLALEVIESIKVYGVFNASPELKEALGDRIKN